MLDHYRYSNLEEKMQIILSLNSIRIKLRAYTWIWIYGLGFRLDQKFKMLHPGINASSAESAVINKKIVAVTDYKSITIPKDIGKRTG